MQANLLLIDHQKEGPFKSPGKGTITACLGGSLEKKSFSSTLAEATRERKTRAELSGKSKIAETKIENSEIELGGPQKDVIQESGKWGTTLLSSQIQGKRAGALSGKESPVEKEAFAGAVLKKNGLKVDLLASGPERPQKTSDVGKQVGISRSRKQIDGISEALEAKSSAKSRPAEQGSKIPRGVEGPNSLLRGAESKSATRTQENIKGSTILQAPDRSAEVSTKKQDAATAFPKARFSDQTHIVPQEKTAKPSTKGQESQKEATNMRSTDRIVTQLLDREPKLPARTQKAVKDFPRARFSDQKLVVPQEKAAKALMKGQESQNETTNTRSNDRFENHPLERQPKLPARAQEAVKDFPKARFSDQTRVVPQERAANSSTNGQESPKEAGIPRGYDRVNGLLHELGVKSMARVQNPAKGTTNVKDVKETERTGKNFKETSGKANRGVQGQEQTEQKFQMAQAKESLEQSGLRGNGTEGPMQKFSSVSEDGKPENGKSSSLVEESGDKKVEKTESNSGENSNLSSRNFSPPDKGAPTIPHAKDSHPFLKSLQTSTFKQIVKSAAFHLENGRSECKIDLKPETLGHLKMQILTENHHVSVKIMTENPLVKEMIESNLQQLKAHFQSQGLEIDKFDVSLAQNWNRNETGGGRDDPQKMKGKAFRANKGFEGRTEAPELLDHSTTRTRLESAVNVFA